MGESGGVPREAKHLFAMYLALGEYKEATQTAVLVAKEDQAAGRDRCSGRERVSLHFLHRELPDCTGHAFPDVLR